MIPQDFIAKWGSSNGITGPAVVLNEEQAAQSHLPNLARAYHADYPA